MKVILATDGTEHSDAAVELAGTLGLGSGDEVLILSVVDMSLPFSADSLAGPPMTAGEIEAAARQVAEKSLERAAAGIDRMLAARGIKVATELQTGSPDRRIVETAERIGADLVIVGSHGYNRWERLLLGSVSDSVVHHAPCSVLIARSK